MASVSSRNAILMALAGFSLLSVGDAVVKTMTGEWPGTAVAALRYLCAVGWMSVVLAAWKGRAAFAIPRPVLQWGRGASVAVATVCFFMAVMAMPLADATSILFISPMMTLILAGIFLKERVPPAAWGATCLAFAGVLVVLRPNVLALGASALWPLGAASGMAALMILNRKAAGLAGVLEMQWILALPALPLLFAATGLLHATGAPQCQVAWPSATMVAKCAFVSISATFGHLLIYAATVRASAAVIAPMTYVQLIVATALGWLLFGNRPDATSLAGAALIVLAGLWLWHAQRPRDVPEMPD